MPTTSGRPVQQSGNGCDYVSEKVICQSSVAGGRLRFGSRSYKTLLLMEVESLEPRTAARIADFVAAGGRVIAIGKVPHKGSASAMPRRRMPV